MIIVMYILLVLLLILILYFFLRRRDTRYITKSVLSPEECNELIDVAETFEFDTKLDSVDDNPEYQIDVLDITVKNEKLWEMCKKIYETKMPKMDKTIDYVILKRYVPGERTHIPPHYDDSHTTMSFLLSNVKDFKGGELYVFSQEESKKIDKLREDVPESELVGARKRIVDSYNKLPIQKYKQGDLIVYPGKYLLHGTLPVTSGKRYVLTYFFN
jgi:hypothetical protein